MPDPASFSPRQAEVCASKVRYDTRLDALTHLQRIDYLRSRDCTPARWRESHGECALYRCSICNGWHLTSQPNETSGTPGRSVQTPLATAPTGSRPDAPPGRMVA
jgi:hypothetical protein